MSEQMRMLAMNNPALARMLDEQERQKQYQQRVAPTNYGNDAMGRFLTAYSGAQKSLGEGAQAVAGNLMGQEKPMGMNEKMAVQADQMRKDAEKKAVQAEQSKVQAVVQGINANPDMSREEKANIIRQVASKVITPAQAMQFTMPTGEKKRAQDALRQKQDKNQAIVQGINQRKDLSTAERANLIRLVSAGAIPPSNVVDLTISKSSNPKPEDVLKLASEYNVTPSKMANAIRTNNYDGLVLPTAKDGMGRIEKLTGIPAENLKGIYGEKVASRVAAAVLEGDVKGLSAEQIKANMLMVINSDTPTGSDNFSEYSDTAKKLGLANNLLQGYDKEKVLEAAAYFDANFGTMDLRMLQAKSRELLMRGTKTKGTATEDYSGTELQTILRLTDEQYKELPYDNIILAMNALHSPKDKNETTEQLFTRVRNIAAGVEMNTTTLPSLDDILGSRYTGTLSSSSLPKVREAHAQGLLEGESVEDFKSRVNSLAVPEMDDKTKEMYQEYELSARSFDNTKMTVPTAYAATDAAFTGFWSPAKLLLAKASPTDTFDSNIQATEYLERIQAAITLDDASKLKGALSDADLAFLKQSVGTKELNAQSIRVALQELMIKKQRDVLIFNKLNEYKRNGDIESMENFNSGAYLDEEIMVRGQKMSRRRAARLMALNILENGE